MWILYFFLILIGVVFICCIIPSAIAGHLDNKKKRKFVNQVLNQGEQQFVVNQVAQVTSTDEGIDLHFNSIEDLRHVL